ncbi:polysaccharide biosynthesis/export family protein [Microvirga antarctica]|uniref:polysaccharide biosynthesis/export family protein n=1 Tax=Microvirga antarctica TaxID=2819233 RepID=UPI001B317B71|nr:polysaccharide biosynthesis/export family protein [Microvirga antarctica]
MLAPALLLSAIAWAPPALADYKLDSGDTIEVSVFGRNDLARRAMIDADGKIQVPLIGEVAASGLTMSELRARIKDLLATSDSVRGGDVIVDIVEHRPFYVYGNVTRGGAYPYRPGMTVRHALALAGGYETIRSQGNTTPVASAELRGRYRTLSADYAKQQVRVASLRAEAEGKSELDLSGLPRSVRSQKVVAELIELETQQLKASMDEREKEKKYLAVALQLADAQVGALDRGQKQDEEASRQQADELARVADLTKRGLASTGRTTDEQRAMVLTRSREMDTAARLAQARQAREEMARRLQKADERQAKLPQDLQVAIATLDGIGTQMEALGEQLALSGNIGSQAEATGRSTTQVAIFRKTGETQARVPATEDSPVQPGDVVEITIKFELSPATPAN